MFKQISRNYGYSSGLSFDSYEQHRNFLKKTLIGSILWAIHKKQGTEACLVQAIEPYLSREDRALFGLV